MQAILFYLTYPFIYSLSKLPIKIQLGISDLLYLIIYYVVGYRRSIVKENLKNSFPDKSEQERTEIMKKFYRQFCDLLLTSLRSLTISAKEINERNIFIHPEIVEFYKNKGRNLLMVLGHYGKWEIAGSAFGLRFNLDLIAAYKPLHNKYFNRMAVKSRSKYGNILVPKKEMFRYLDKTEIKQKFLALVADQSPNPKNMHWLNFLNQKTAVMTGIEKIARDNNFVVIYIGIKTTSRRISTIEITLLTDDPNSLPQNGIIEKYMQLLEQDIKADPIPYLWSHNRWKIKYPNN